MKKLLIFLLLGYDRNLYEAFKIFLCCPDSLGDVNFSLGERSSKGRSIPSLTYRILCNCLIRFRTLGVMSSFKRFLFSKKCDSRAALCSDYTYLSIEGYSTSLVSNYSLEL